MYKHFNPNPIANRVEDCAVRALAFALSDSWESIYIQMAINGYLMGDMPHANNVWGAVLRQHGFKRGLISDSCPDCYTVEDFAQEHPQGLFIVVTSSHVLAICDGDWFDTWNSGQEHPIFYWYKEE